MEKSIVKQWWFWVIIVVAALGIGFGVSYLTRNNDSDDKETERSEKKEKKKKNEKEESDNPFVGTWYLPASEGIITIKFKENGECSYSQGNNSIKCSYEYDDEKVTINNEEKKG